jgi:hypothetical protein
MSVGSNELQVTRNSLERKDQGGSIHDVHRATRIVDDPALRFLVGAVNAGDPKLIRTDPNMLSNGG